jgi:hypothetical protein
MVLRRVDAFATFQSCFDPQLLWFQPSHVEAIRNGIYPATDMEPNRARGMIYLEAAACCEIVGASTFGTIRLVRLAGLAGQSDSTI